MWILMLYLYLIANIENHTGGVDYMILIKIVEYESLLIPVIPNYALNKPYSEDQTAR